MTDQPWGWLQIVLGVVGLVLQFLGVKSTHNRRQRRVRYTHWKIGKIERTTFEQIDDSQT